MGGVDLSNQLIQYYSVHHKTMHWYWTIFLHFLDISATNAYILYRELAKEKQQTPLRHRKFLEQLTAELCGVTDDIPPTPRAPQQHLPVPCSNQEPSAHTGRRKCALCFQKLKKWTSTPWMCFSCGVPLCLIPARNSFYEYHQ